MKTLNALKLTLAALVISSSLAANAIETVTVRSNGPANPAMTAVVQNLKRLYPNTLIKEVITTPVPGLYQVVMGKNVAFVDETGRYFVFGHMFDMKEQKDLTEEAASNLSKIDFKSLPLKDAIKTVHGTGARQVAVFMDPDCPFCKQLEATLARLTDVTIYTFLFPLDALHPDARSKATSVWCSKDQAKAWSDLMVTGQATPATCTDTPLERNARLAESMGINGTPTLIFPSGQLVPGAARLEQLENMLGGGK